MKELKKEVEQAVEKELERISEKWGRQYASHHEAYGVIAEECDEAEDHTDELSGLMTNLLWSLRKDICNNEWGRIATAATLGACELIQVAAVAVKAQRGYGNESE